MRRVTKRKLFLITGLLFVAVFVGSCIGSFKYTTKLYDWNRRIEGKWGQEGVFFAFSLLPIYGLTVLGDALIFNSIEFWSDDDYAATEENKLEEVVLSEGDERAVLSRLENGKKMQVKKFVSGKLDRTIILEKLDDNTLRVTSDQGETKTVRLADRKLHIDHGDGVDTINF